MTKQLLDRLEATWDAHVHAANADRTHAVRLLVALERVLARAGRATGQVLHGLWVGHVELERQVLRAVAGGVAMLLLLGGAAALNSPARADIDPIAFEGWAGFLQRVGPLHAPGALSGTPGSGFGSGPLAAPAQPATDVGPVPPANRGALPVGKGMWMWMPERADGGNPQAVVNRAVATDLSHIYVRTGSLRGGFDAQQWLNDLLPLAHDRGIRIYGWDFPYLENVEADVARAVAAIRYRTPGGHGIDGFTADIETRGEGVNITPQTAQAYGTSLRRAVGPTYPLIATVPRPNSALITYPFADVVAHFDAIAPMVYWLNRQPDTDLRAAMSVLQGFGKPIIPIGQAYDGTVEGGRPGTPTRDEIQRFMQVGDETGAIGVSFWSWQHASGEIWDAIRDAHQFTLPATPEGAQVGFTAGQIRQYQGLLTSLGFAVPSTGVWDGATINAVRAYQAAGRLKPTGVIDHSTRRLLLTPFDVPLQPQS